MARTTSTGKWWSRSQASACGRDLALREVADHPTQRLVLLEWRGRGSDGGRSYAAVDAGPHHDRRARSPWSAADSRRTSST